MNLGRVETLSTQYRLRLLPSAGASSGGSSFSSSTVSYFRSPSADKDVGVRLSAIKNVSGWFYRVEVPLFSIDWTPGSAIGGEEELQVWLDHKLMAGDDYWLLKGLGISIYLDGSFQDSYSPGDTGSSGDDKFASQIPLYGIHPFVYASATAPVPDSPSFSGGATMAGSAVGGGAWFIDGEPQLDPAALPDVLVAPPGISCGIAGGTLPSVGASDIWTVTAEGSIDLSYSSSHIDFETRASFVQAVPDLDRRIERMSSDYKAKWVKFATSRAYQQGNSKCITWEPPDPPVETNATPTEIEEIPAYAKAENVVGNATHEIEDLLYARSKCLYYAEVITSHSDFSGGLFTGSSAHKDSIEYVGCDSVPFSGSVAGLGCSDASVRYHDYVTNPHQSYKLSHQELNVQGTSLTPEEYEIPARQQWLNGVDEEELNTRNNVIIDPTLAAATWHNNEYGEGPRMLGACRWQTVDVEPLMSYQYDSGSEDLWSSTHCSLSFGSDITLTPTGGFTDLTIKLDLGSWDIEPYMRTLQMDQLRQVWDPTHMVSIDWSLECADGTLIPIALTNDGWNWIPQGEADHFAGSWGIDNKVHSSVDDTGVDSVILGNGRSATTMADPELASCFELGFGRNYKYLRADIEVDDTSHTVSIDYPEVRKHDTRDPVMFHESGMVATFLNPDHSMVRHGQYKWTAAGAMISPPSVRGLGSQSTAVDGLADSRVWYLIKASDEDLTTQLATLFDSDEGQTVALCSADTASVYLPTQTNGTVKLAILNHKSEVVPLSISPRPARNTTSWQETGTRGLRAYSWCLETQRYVVPGPVPMHIVRLGSPDTTITTVGAMAPSGFSDTYHREPVDNQEVPTDFAVVCGDNTFANVTPWHGYYAELKASISAGWLDYDVSLDGMHGRVYTGNLVPAADLPINFGAKRGGPWLDLDSGLEAKSMALRWLRGSRKGKAYILLCLNDGSLNMYETATEGRTTGLVMTIDTNVAIGDFEETRQYHTYVYYVYLGENILRCTVYDRSLNVVDSFTTNITDISNTIPFRVRESSTSTGGWRMGILYTDTSNNLLFKTSDRQGKLFS